MTAQLHGPVGLADGIGCNNFWIHALAPWRRVEKMSKNANFSNFRRRKFVVWPPSKLHDPPLMRLWYIYIYIYIHIYIYICRVSSRNFLQNLAWWTPTRPKKVAQKCNKNDNVGGWWDPNKRHPPPHISENYSYFSKKTCLITCFVVDFSSEKWFFCEKTKNRGLYGLSFGK